MVSVDWMIQYWDCKEFIDVQKRDIFKFKVLIDIKFIGTILIKYTHESRKVVHLSKYQIELYASSIGNYYESQVEQLVVCCIAVCSSFIH